MTGQVSLRNVNNCYLVNGFLLYAVCGGRIVREASVKTPTADSG